MAALDKNPEIAREIYANALKASVPGAPAQYERSGVLLEDARFERNQGERPAETLRLYRKPSRRFTKRRTRAPRFRHECN